MIKSLAVLCVALVFIASADAKKVVDLPNSSNVDVESYAGLISIDASKDASLFYWFFNSTSPSARDDPLVLWMTGGPGCSSELAVVFENGSFSINNETLELEPNPYSWNKVANVVYIDQPFGVGFSPYSNGDKVTNEAQMAEAMYTFLQKFLTEEFPEYADNAFYISGESFGGHYVPALGARIVAGNEAGQGVHINLVATSIGDGWVVPEIQYNGYGPYAYQNNLIDSSVYAAINSTYKKCHGLYDLHLWDLAMAECQRTMSQVLAAAGNINVYNIDLPCVNGGLCYNFDPQTKYFNLPATQKALGVDKTFAICDESFITTKDSLAGFSDDVATLLAAGVRVLSYNGDLDLICNGVGGEMWIQAMDWPHQSTFNALPMTNWMVDGNAVGQYRTGHNMTFLTVIGAGHMVPHDQPANAFVMFKNFINNTPF